MNRVFVFFILKLLENRHILPTFALCPCDLGGRHLAEAPIGRPPWLHLQTEIICCCSAAEQNTVIALSRLTALQPNPSRLRSEMFRNSPWRIDSISVVYKLQNVFGNHNQNFSEASVLIALYYMRRASQVVMCLALVYFHPTLFDGFLSEEMAKMESQFDGEEPGKRRWQEQYTII